jgi:ribA/ribD-fused uncharacterized protein
MAIESFTGQYAFLSNCYPSPISFEGIDYPTVEHAYQAQKTLDLNFRRTIAEARTPGEAKRLGRHVQLRADWEQTKVHIMVKLLVLKFSDPILERKLLNTGTEFLIEGNDWKDTFWGYNLGDGKNVLGFILMKIRRVAYGRESREILTKEGPFGMLNIWD